MIPSLPIRVELQPDESFRHRHITMYVHGKKPMIRVGQRGIGLPSRQTQPARIMSRVVRTTPGKLSLTSAILARRPDDSRLRMQERMHPAEIRNVALFWG